MLNLQSVTTQKFSSSATVADVYLLHWSVTPLITVGTLVMNYLICVVSTNLLLVFPSLSCCHSLSAQVQGLVDDFSQAHKHLVTGENLALDQDVWTNTPANWDLSYIMTLNEHKITKDLTIFPHHYTYMGETRAHNKYYSCYNPYIYVHGWWSTNLLASCKTVVNSLPFV